MDNVKNSMKSPAFLLTFATLTGLAAAEPDWRPIMRKAIERLDGGATRRSDYSFTCRRDSREFDSSGKVRSQTSMVTRTSPQDGVAVTRVLERDGQPISESEKAVNEEAIRKKVKELKAIPPEQRNSHRRSQDAWLMEMADALDFKHNGDETYRGRPAVVVDVSPRPGYKAKTMRARVFEKMKGRIWLDTADGEIVKAAAEMFDTVNIGFGLLGRIERGTQFHIERMKVDNQFWALERQRMRFAARVMLVKNLNQEVDLKFSDYRRNPQ